MIFRDEKNGIDSDGSEPDLSDEIIRIWNFPFNPKLWQKKSAENCRNSYVAEKCIVSKLSNISIYNFNSTNCRLESRLCLNIT